MQTQNLKLEAVLQQELNSHLPYLYPSALALSRIVRPTQNSIELTIELLDREGPRWYQVLERQAVSDYGLAFSVGLSRKISWPVLVGVANPEANLQQLNTLKSLIINQIRKGSQEEWLALVRLIKATLPTPQTQFSIELLRELSSLFQENQLNDLLLSSAKGQMAIENENVRHQSIEIVTFLEVELLIVQLYRACRLATLRRGVSNSLFASMSNGMGLWVQQALVHAIGYIEQYSVTTGSRDRLVKDELISNALKLVQQLVQIPELELIFAERSIAIASALLRVPVLRLQSQVQDQLNFQYGILSNEFGEDVQSISAQTLNSVALYAPALLRSLLNAIKTALLQPSNEIQLSDGLVRLALLHNLVLTRSDLIRDIVSPLIERIFQQSQQKLALATECRKLRLLLFYGDILTQKHFQALISTTVSMLRDQACNSFAFCQADNIFERIIERSNEGVGSLGRFAQLFKTESKKVGTTLLQAVESVLGQNQNDREQKGMRILRILRKLIEGNQRSVQELALRMTGLGAQWLVMEVKQLWQTGRKNNPLVLELVLLVQSSMKLLQENYYHDVTEKLYPALELLKEPQNIQIVEELLNILELAIDMEKTLSGELCKILVTALTTVVSLNKGNLFSVVNLLKVLNRKQIAEHVLFEWGDLIRFLADLYITYFCEFVKPSYSSLYRQEFDQVASSFEQFLQAYESYWEDNQALRLGLLSGVRGMGDGQWRCRFFLVLHHQAPTQGYDFFSLHLAAACSHRGTMKLVHLYYIDRLLREYNDNTLKEFGQFNQIYQEKLQRRTLEQDSGTSSPFPEVYLKTYVQEGLRQLRTRGFIDLLDYNSMLREFRLE